MEHVWKSSLDGATIGAGMTEKNLKIWKNGCKVCAHHHFDHLEPRWKKSSTTAFDPCIVHVHPYKNISLTRYRVPRKTAKFVPVVPKAHDIGLTFVRTESLLSRAIFKNVLGDFYRGCSCALVFNFFSLCCQMAPLRSIKFQTADFPIFWWCILLWFSVARRVFSLMVMDNGKHVLPVLQCLKRGIAFVSSYIICHTITTALMTKLLVKAITWRDRRYIMCSLRHPYGTTLSRIYTKATCWPATCVPDKQLVSGYIYVDGHMLPDTSCSFGIHVDCISAT